VDADVSDVKEQSMMRSLTMILILTFAMAIAAPSLGADEKDKGTSDKKDKPETPGKISIKNIQFKPTTITIKAGETVTWMNDDDRDHTVIADDGSFKSGKIGSGEKYSFKFPKKGKYTYSCSYHPRMKGVIVVE
jgi:plastocyanin